MPMAPSSRGMRPRMGPRSTTRSWELSHSRALASKMRPFPMASARAAGERRAARFSGVSIKRPSG